jgi:hypothetical protein
MQEQESLTLMEHHLRRIAREACKEMEQETMSFRFIYLKQAMDRWGARTDILLERKIQNIWWIKYFDQR